MNIFFRAGELLPNFRILLLKSALLSTLCFYMFSLSAQSPRKDSGAGGLDQIKPLKIGDTIPELLWNTPLKVVNHPSAREQITLNDYRDKKLIILDFWATWCGSCIKSFPKIAQLQTNFSEVQYLLVNSTSTRNTAESIREFLLARRKAYDLMSIVKDTVMDLSFPHEFLPHYVLIKDNTIVNILSSNDFEQIQWDSLLNNPLYEQEKRVQLSYDFRYPLFKNGNGGSRPDVLFSSFISPYIDGLPIGIHTGGENTERMTFINRPLIQLFKFAMPELAKVPQVRLIYEKKHADILSDRNDKNRPSNLFTYEIETPLLPYERVRTMVAEDLKRYFGYEVTYEKRKLNCWVLSAWNKTKMRKLDNVIPKGTYITEQNGLPVTFNGTFGKLTKYLEDVHKIPFINDTGIEKRISMVLPPELTDVVMLKDYLRQYGIVMREEVREVDVAVISLNK